MSFNEVASNKVNSVNYTQYTVWELPVRLFHWINVVSVLGLIFVACIMMFKAELGITGLEAKIAIKQVHIVMGYVFAINLLMRIVWGFVGNQYALWKNIIPGKGFTAILKSYMGSIKNGKPQTYLGHNPLGRLAVTAMITLMLALLISGLTRAATDVYYPPFGGAVVSYIAAEGVNPDSLKPYDKTGTNPEKRAHVKVLKDLAGEIHEIAAFTLMFIILLHIVVVVRSEVKEESGLVSAMFSGKKRLKDKPEDVLE